jgi:hypothetical protein
MHVLLEQVAPEFGDVRTGQALPHPPQLLLSVWMSTQALPQGVKPLLQTQEPLLQFWLAPHGELPAE